MNQIGLNCHVVPDKFSGSLLIGSNSANFGSSHNDNIWFFALEKLPHHTLLPEICFLPGSGYELCATFP